MAPHNDHLDEIVRGFPIALLSLGATRRMTIRAKEPPRRVLQVDLSDGSLLVMSYETQLHYTHGIPKTKESVGARISLAFRVKPARDPWQRRPSTAEGSPATQAECPPRGGRLPDSGASNTESLMNTRCY